MTGYEFFDTNVLYYANIDPTNNEEKKKHDTASHLIDESVKTRYPWISVQVLEEFINNAQKKAKKSIDEVGIMLDNFWNKFSKISLTPELTKDAVRIAKEYKFSIWDCFIIAAALYADCEILYSEDLQNGQIIDGTLKIVNPFAAILPEKKA
jgi:predicted nucleic acid-binding protein